MANATLLQIVDITVAEMGLLGTVPSAVVSSTDMMIVQLLNLLNGLGNDLVREYQWQWICKQHNFTTVYYQYTGTTTEDSTTLSALSSTTGLTTNPTYFTVTGNNIPQDTQLVSVNAGAGTAVISNAATATGSTITLTFAQTRYEMPTDFDRLVDGTEWDKSNHWELLGPTGAPGWAWLKSGFIATGPRERFRILGNLFQIFPPQASTLTLGFEYVRNHWVLAASAADVSKSAFTIDTDTSIFPARVLVEGLKLRFKRETGRPLTQYTPQDIAKGFVTRLVDLAKTSDAGNPMLIMAPSRESVLIGPQNIPDGNWNL